MTGALVIRILLEAYASVFMLFWLILTVRLASRTGLVSFARLRTKLIARLPYIPWPRGLWLAGQEALSDDPVPYWPAYLPNARVAPDPHELVRLDDDNETEA